MTLGQAIGGAAGAIGGFLIGGPSGAILGFQIGMGVGSIIDPPRADESPGTLQFQDLQFNTFARNLPVPVVYGLNKVAGNILWIGNTRTEVVEREATESGKGAPEPPKTREVWYHADFIQALSEGEIVGVSKVFLDDEEITDQEGLDWIEVLGTGTQAADSKVVQALGADAPAFRHVGYLRFSGKLGQANRIPTVTAEVSGRRLAEGEGSDFSAAISAQAVTDAGLPLSVSYARRLVRTADNVLLAAAQIQRTAGGELLSLYKSLNQGTTWSQQQLSATLACILSANLLLNPDNDDLHYSTGQTNTAACADPTYAQLARSGNSWSAVGGLTTPLIEITHTAMTMFSLAREPTSGRLWAACVLRTSDGVRHLYVEFSDDDGATWGPSGGILIADYGTGGAGDFSVAPLLLYHSDRVYVFWDENVQVGGSGLPEAAFRFSSHAVGDAAATWSAAATIVADAAYRLWNVLEDSAGTLYAFVYDDVGIARVFRLTDPATWTLVSTDATAIGSSNYDKHGYCVIGGSVWEIYPTATTLKARRFNADAFRDDQSLGGDLAEIAGAASFHGPPIGSLVQYLFEGSPASEADKVYFGQSVVVLDKYSNPGQILYDLLTNARYGLSLPAARVDKPSFDSVAALCDEIVTNPDGTTERRFELDTVLDSQRPVLDHLRDMLATFRGFLVWSQGTAKLRVQKAEDVSQSFDMGSIVADSFQWRKQSYRDRPNVVRIEYINAADDYRHDYVEAFDDWDIDQTGERRELTLRLLGIKRTTQAVRMAQYYLDQAIHIVHACTFRVGIGALQAEVGDVIGVTHDVPAWAAKAFRIMQIEEAEDDELTLSCLEYNADIYHDKAIATQESLAQAINVAAVPWHVIRFSAHKRPNENVIEAAFTRAQTADNFAGALMYRRRAGGAFERLEGTALALAPTAFLDGQVRSVAQAASGAPAGAARFTDAFSRAANTSLGVDWREVGQDIFRVQSHSLQRGDPASGDAAAISAAAVTTGHVFSGDTLAQAAMLHTDGLGIRPRVGLVARWQDAGSYGQFYYFEYMTRTLSHSILEVGLFRVTSGEISTLLSRAAVASGTYFSTPGSATTFQVELSSFTLTGRLNGAQIVSAIDSWIQGNGEGGVARVAVPKGYPDVVRADSPLGYWRLGENSGSLAADWSNNTNVGTHLGQSSRAIAGLLTGDADRAIGFTAAASTEVRVPDAALLNPTSGLALECWFEVRSYPVLETGIGNLITKRSIPPGPQVGYVLRINSAGQPAFTHGPAPAFNAPTSVLLNTPYHLAATWDGSFQNIWLNGSLVGSQAHTGAMSSDTDPLMFGGHSYGAGNQQYFTGIVDEAAIYGRALTSAQIVAHYRAGLNSGSLVAAQGERWDDFEWGPSVDVNSPLLVRGLVDGWAARVFDPSSVLLAGAVASEGTARIALPMAGGSQPASGFLQVFADQSFATPAPDGRRPATGFADFRGGDVYDFDRAAQFLSAVQTHVPIFHAKGGFANVGSARIRAEQMGYATFTDSRLEGVTRGAGGTPATSHTNILSLGAFVITTGAVGSQSLLDLTAAATDPLSNMPFFADNSSFVYLGASSKFARAGMFLERNASGVSLHYEYSTGDGSWASLVASSFLGPTDQTSGLRRSGDILLEPPGDWSPTNRVSSGGATLGDASSRYFLRMLRTNSLLATPPKEVEIRLDGDLLVAVRNANAFLYEPTLQDSAQALDFKAIAVGIRGQMADGTKAPVTHVWSA